MTHTANTDARSALVRVREAVEEGWPGAYFYLNEDVAIDIADLLAILSALPQVRGMWDVRPQVSAPEFGREPSWRMLVEEYYRRHLPDADHVAMADEYFTALAAAPKLTTEDAIGSLAFEIEHDASVNSIACVWPDGRWIDIASDGRITHGVSPRKHAPHQFMVGDPKAAVEAERERGFDLLLLKALLCLSGFAGEGLQIEGFEDPADVYHEIAEAIGMEDADDDDLRAHIKIESRRTIDDRMNEAQAIAAWNTRPVHSPMPGREEIARLLCEMHGGDPDAVASEEHDSWEGPLWTAFVTDANKILALFPRSDELVEATGDGPEFAAAERAAAMYRFDTATDRARAKEMFRIGWKQSASLRQSTPQ